MQPLEEGLGVPYGYGPVRHMGVLERNELQELRVEVRRLREDLDAHIVSWNYWLPFWTKLYYWVMSMRWWWR